jgi:hypothetical protein
MDKNHEQDKAMEPVDQKLGTIVLVGFALLIMLAAACYYFNIELTDLT